MLTDFRLKIFMTVASEGSFTRAAQQLGVTQPAVSQHIAELEKQLGKPLFQRGRGAVSLTPEGFVFQEYAAIILHWYSAADTLFGPAGSLTFNRPVSIAATAFTAETFLPDLLRDLVAMTSTSFTVRTFPEDAFPESQEADLYLYTAARSDTLNFDVASVIGTVPATLVTAAATAELPEEIRYAVWTPYRSLVPQDIFARTALFSDSLPLLADLIRTNPSLAGIVPSHASQGLFIHPEPLPHLQLDVHLRASEAFSATAIAKWIAGRYQ